MNAAKVVTLKKPFYGFWICFSCSHISEWKGFVVYVFLVSFAAAIVLLIALRSRLVRVCELWVTGHELRVMSKGSFLYQFFSFYALVGAKVILWNELHCNIYSPIQSFKMFASQSKNLVPIQQNLFWKKIVLTHLNQRLVWIF